MIPAVLTIGGSDSSGGAGIQADLRTFAAFDIKGCSAITALTAQNPEQIERIEPVPLAQLEAEIRSIFSYYDVKVVKTGMLYNGERIALIARLLKELHASKPLVVDPVMVSSSGRTLLDEAAIGMLKQQLFPIATLVTPNIPEAERLLGEKRAQEQDACSLARSFGTAVLLKGGHIHGNTLIDVLCIDGEKIIFPHDRQVWDEEAMHGTGCRLASATAASLAQGNAVAVAVSEAIHWLQLQ